MKSVDWLANDTIRCRDVRLVVTETLETAPPEGDEQVAIFKPRKMVEEMAQALQDVDVRRMLELGMWDGGSAIFFEHHLDLERYVGLDTRRRVPFLEHYIERHGLAGSMRIRGSTSQDDEAALETIFREDFEGADLDLVVDDCSHFLEQTRKSFAICFPRLRTGGWYIIEDWSWGHILSVDWPQLLEQRPELERKMPPSPLVFELLLVCGSSEDVIRRILVNRYFVALERGETPLDKETMKPEALYDARGLPLPWVQGVR